MMRDRFVRTLLVLVAVLLTLNLVLPRLSPNSTSADQARPIQYKVIRLPQPLSIPGLDSFVEGLIIQQAQDGWELVQIYGFPAGAVVNFPTVTILVFKK